MLARRTRALRGSARRTRIVTAASKSLFGEVFFRIHVKSMYVDFLSSHRNCVQLSQPALAYATASLLPPCPRSPFSSFSPVIFVSRRWRRVRRGSPSSRGPRPLETFAHGPVSSGPMGAASSSSLKIEPRKFNGIKYLPFSRIHVQILC